jgi:hypothetical protein
MNASGGRFNREIKLKTMGMGFTNPADLIKYVIINSCHAAIPAKNIL